jgi:hypothetical protein
MRFQSYPRQVLYMIRSTTDPSTWHEALLTFTSDRLVGSPPWLAAETAVRAKSTETGSETQDGTKSLIGTLSLHPQHPIRHRSRVAPIGGSITGSQRPKRPMRAERTRRSKHHKKRGTIALWEIICCSSSSSAS